MILFIFEGKKTEPNLFKTIEKLYFATAKTPNMKHGALKSGWLQQFAREKRACFVILLLQEHRWPTKEQMEFMSFPSDF